jgi:uncharacterized membrane protein (DUF2068 family)
MSTEPELPRDKKPGQSIPLPGIAVIALYMLVLSTVVAFGVIGHQYPAFLLLFSVAAAVASFGLLRLQRWGWALTLAATFLLMSYQLYLLSRTHEAPAGVMGGVNLILFLYLVRPEVRSRLR